MIADDVGRVEFEPVIIRPNLADLDAFLGLEPAAKLQALAGLREYGAWLSGTDPRQPPKVQSVTAQLQNLLTTMALVVSVMALSITTPTTHGLTGIVDAAVLLLTAIVLGIALWAGLRIGKASSVDNRVYAANLRLFGEVATAWLGAIEDTRRT